MPIKLNKRANGSILIFALWAMALLGIFAVQIGMHIRQRVMLLSRLEHRNQLHFTAEAGVQKAIAIVRNEINHSSGTTVEGKIIRHNNPGRFAEQDFGATQFEVKYQSDARKGHQQWQYGIVDEERKLNVNVVDVNTLARLIQNITLVGDHSSQGIAEAIVDWREPGQTQITGFYSDDYYYNLRHPYDPKNAEFESIDELLLVRGMSESVFNKLRPFITIYGDGQININTASREILISMGLTDTLADKIIAVRKGQDEIENTVDDYVFQRTFDIASEVNKFTPLTENEMKQIDNLNNAGILKLNSDVYLIQSYAQYPKGDEVLQVDAVYNFNQNKLLYWREKF